MTAIFVTSSGTGIGKTLGYLAPASLWAAVPGYAAQLPSPKAA